ncbi:hypothetical protein ACIQW5_26555 [Methylorubrum thiocyanatum]|uniref:hypothetical protein n=1 Tax=Methylorubrum thiocyanatum TaxID=47958 RepID=UPI00383B0DD2
MSAKPATTVAELADRIAATRSATPAGTERQFRHAVRGEEARTGRRGNGGPDLDAPEPVVMRGCSAEVLHLGALLFGDRHTTDLARVCCEDPGQVRRWRRGEGAGPSETAVRWIREEALARMAAIQAGLDRLAAVRPPPPPPAPPAPQPEPEPEVAVAPGVAPEDAAWFLDGLSRATGGRPSPVREVLSARRPPRARHWTAEVVVFDGQTHTLDCDRGADLDGRLSGSRGPPATASAAASRASSGTTRPAGSGGPISSGAPGRARCRPPPSRSLPRLSLPRLRIRRWTSKTGSPVPC